MARGVPACSVPGEARAQLTGGLRRLVHDAARGALEPASLAERDAEHAPARVARGDGDPSGDPGDRGPGAGGRSGDLALAALVLAVGVLCDRLVVPADRGSVRLAGRARRLRHRIRAFLGLAHRASSCSVEFVLVTNTPAGRSHAPAARAAANGSVADVGPPRPTPP